MPLPGAGGLPKVAVTAADGARIEVYLHGAHVTSWIPAGEQTDRLFVSASSLFAPGVAIRGGVPVCFPQFADLGPLPMHGFARVSAWALIESGRNTGGAAHVRLRLADSVATRALWPYPFAIELDVTALGPTLALAFAVTNTGSAAFTFTTALHTYLRIADVHATSIRGLQGAHYRDKVLQQDDMVEGAAELDFDREIDRVYRCAPDPVELREPARTLAIHATGYPDTVTWNPGAQKGATIPDMEPGGYARMVCVEAAVASRAITLAPQAAWEGSQTLTAKR
ncbi:MAG: D-hexose-6-phosphate mutarotase [Casimicrobiaceae bacterium]